MTFEIAPGLPAVAGPSSLVEWNTELYLENNHLIGLEVFNQENQYLADRPLQDSLQNSALKKVSRYWG